MRDNRKQPSIVQAPPREVITDEDRAVWERTKPPADPITPEDRAIWEQTKPTVTTPEEEAAIWEGTKPEGDAPFEHDFNWGKMLGNVLPNAIKNIKDLGAIFTPRSLHTVLKLSGELTSMTRQPYSPVAGGSTPTFNAIVEFYANNYDLVSAEGRERFQKYLEENPLDVLSDAVAIVSGVGGAGLTATKMLKPIGAGIGAGIGAVKGGVQGAVKGGVKGAQAGIKTGRVTGADTGFGTGFGIGGKIDQVVGDVKTHNTRGAKAVRGAARIGEAVVDPGAAVGRTLGKIPGAIRTKNTDFKDLYKVLELDTTDLGVDNFSELVKEGIDAGYKPQEMWKFFDEKIEAETGIKNASKSRDGIAMLDVNLRAELSVIGQLMKELDTTNMTKIRQFTETGKQFAGKYAGLLASLGGVGASIRFNDWTYAIIGAIGGMVTEGWTRNLRKKEIELIFKKAPEWGQAVKMASTNVGRAGQRAGRISEDRKKQMNARDPLFQLPYRRNLQ